MRDVLQDLILLLREDGDCDVAGSEFWRCKCSLGWRDKGGA